MSGPAVRTGGSGRSEASPAAGPPARRGDPLAWAGVVLLCLSAALAAVLEALLTPLYAGTHLVPVAVLFAVLSNVAFPRLARRLVPALSATALPFVVWLVMIIGFGVVARPEGDVILPGGSVQWVSYGVMLGGALAGTVTVVTATPAPANRERRR